MAATRNRPSPDALVDLAGRVRVGLAAAGVGPGARLCLALSGGVDSVVLLDLLHRLRPEFGFHLAAAHVHHGLSPHADHWLGACAAHCERRGVPFSAVRVAVSRAHPQGLEAAARAARYVVLDAQDADWLVLGHHLDDQAETLLFRLLRGTGLRGAGAMGPVERPRQGLPRLRPLLGARRKEIEAWAVAVGLTWVEDDSNADPRYARNRLRLEILPALEAAFPGAAPTLARAAGHFREASDLLDELAAEDHRRWGGEPWCVEALAGFSDARLRNLLRWAIRGRGSPTPESSRLDEALRQLRLGGGEATLRLPLGAWALGVYRGQAWLEPAVATPPLPREVRFGAGPPAEERVPWGAGWVVFEPGSGAGLHRTRLAGRVCRLSTRWPALRLRPRAEGPTRSFKNLCQEAGIPGWWREALPVLAVDGQAAWIGGIGVAAEFACPPGGDGVVLRWLAPHGAGLALADGGE